MALQASGPISFSNLRSEYGNFNTSVSLGMLYRGGTKVKANSGNNPSTNLSANVPTGGTISVNNFYSQAQGFKFTDNTNRSNKNAQDYFGSDYTLNYPKILIVNSTISSTNIGAVSLNFPGGLSGSTILTLNGTISSSGGICLQNQSGTNITINGSGNIIRGSKDGFVAALQGNGSVRINYIGGFGGASGADFRHSDYGNAFANKLTRSGNTFTLSWTYNEIDYYNAGAGSRDISNMFPLDANGNYDATNTTSLTNTSTQGYNGRDQRDLDIGRELRNGVMYYWFCSNNKNTSLELSNDRYIQYGHVSRTLTTENSQRSSIIQSYPGTASSGLFSISGPTIS